MGSRKQREQERPVDLRAVSRFSWVTMAAAAVLCLCFGYLIVRQAERAVTDAYASSTAAQLSGIVIGQIDWDDPHEPFEDDEVKRLDGLLAGLSAAQSLDSFAIWSEHGRALYSRDHSIIGDLTPVEGALSEALDGRTSVVSNWNSETASKQRLGNKSNAFVRVFVPVTATGDETIEGSAEITLSTAPLAPTVRRLTILVGLGLAALFGLIFIVVRRAGVMLLRQYARLLDFAELVETESICDKLTGLSNRCTFDKRVAEEVGRAQRYRRSFSLVLLDIDGLSKVNERFGRKAGDEVLQKTASLIRANTRSVDFAARHGDDEFAIILPETDLKKAFVAVERIRAGFETILNQYRSPRVPLTISVGLAEYPACSSSEDGLATACELALYSSKEKGGNKTSVSSEPPVRERPFAERL